MSLKILVGLMMLWTTSVLQLAPGKTIDFSFRRVRADNIEVMPESGYEVIPEDRWTSKDGFFRGFVSLESPEYSYIETENFTSYRDANGVVYNMEPTSLIFKTYSDETILKINTKGTLKPVSRKGKHSLIRVYNEFTSTVIVIVTADYFGDLQRNKSNEISTEYLEIDGGKHNLIFYTRKMAEDAEVIKKKT